MNAYATVAIHNVALIAMTGGALYITESLWALLPLVFLMQTKSKEGAK